MNTEIANARILESYILKGLFEESEYEKACKSCGSELITCLLGGQYTKVIQLAVSRGVIKPDVKDRNDLNISVKERVGEIVTQSDNSNTVEGELEALGIAVGCLQTFVYLNWLGPTASGTVTDEDVIGFTNKQSILAEMREDLMCDGEDIYALCLGVEYLYIARLILTDCKSLLQNLQTAEWWLMRCVYIHQLILDDKSATLKEQILELIETVSKKEPLMTDDLNKDLLVQFNLEAGYICHMFFEYRKAREHFTTAQKHTGLLINLTGVLGKRTRFQSEDKAQLILEVKRDEHTRKEESCIKTSLPKALNLDDDTVLDAINLSEPDTEHVVDMSCLEQSVVVGAMENHLRSHASQEKLTEEEAGAYLDCVLSQVKCWSVSVACLCTRSRLEKGSRRRVERAMMQIEELVNQIKHQDPPPKERLFLFYSVKVPPSWKLQKQLAELLLSIGAIGSALEVFERLQLWEDVISCYKRLGKMEKAETVIREQLAIQETANLWCFLGDVTSDINHYLKAWELSGHRHARTQRCMGYLYMGKEEYLKSMECFQKSLSINALQVPVWFTYGCACMAAQKYEEAVKAFKRCVNIDTDNFEAWNNLASAYVRLKDKKKAFLTLKESIKCNYENWRVWENLLVVATDCGEFEDVILAYHRLMDLKGKWVDIEVLKILVKGCTENYLDAKGFPASRHQLKLLELFGRITSKVVSNGDIWRLYAELTGSLEEQNSQTQQKVIQYLQKSHRCMTQEVNWEKSFSKCKEVGEQSLHLADFYLNYCQKSATNQESISLLQSAKMMIKSVISKIKVTHTDPVTEELCDDLKELIVTMETKLQTIISTINDLK